MNIHDRIQKAVRQYMGSTFGHYPSAIVVSSAVWQRLSTCPPAVSKMRTARITDGGTPCAIILYSGMWLLVSPGGREFLLLDELPTSLSDLCL